MELTRNLDELEELRVALNTLDKYASKIDKGKTRARIQQLIFLLREHRAYRTNIIKNGKLKPLPIRGTVSDVRTVYNICIDYYNSERKTGYNRNMIPVFVNIATHELKTKSETLGSILKVDRSVISYYLKIVDRGLKGTNKPIERERLMNLRADVQEIKEILRERNII